MAFEGSVNSSGAKDRTFIAEPNRYRSSARWNPARAHRGSILHRDGEPQELPLAWKNGDAHGVEAAAEVQGRMIL